MEKEEKLKSDGLPSIFDTCVDRYKDCESTTFTVANLISWVSTTLKRVVHSTRASETLCAIEGVDGGYVM